MMEFNDIKIPARRKRCASDPPSLDRPNRPVQERVGAISEEIARGKAHQEPSRSYIIPHYRELPRLHCIADRVSALSGLGESGDSKTSDISPNVVTPPLSLPFLGQNVQRMVPCRGNFSANEPYRGTLIASDSGNRWARYAISRHIDSHSRGLRSCALTRPPIITPFPGSRGRSP